MSSGEMGGPEESRYLVAAGSEFGNSLGSVVAVSFGNSVLPVRDDSDSVRQIVWGSSQEVLTDHADLTHGDCGDHREHLLSAD